MLMSKSAEYRNAFDRTAKDIGLQGWEPDSGYGVPSISRAVEYVNSLHADQMLVILFSISGLVLLVYILRRYLYG